MGMVAPPIGLVELTVLLEKNGIDYKPSYPAVEAAHVKYLAACAELRSGDFERFKKGIDIIEASGREPDVEKAKRTMDQYLGILRKTVALDESLFDALRTALPEADHAGVSRAAASRIRTVWRTTPNQDATNAINVDVPVILRNLPWSADGSGDWRSVPHITELRVACENALGDFDTRQDRLLRAHVMATMKMSLELSAGTAGIEHGEVLNLDHLQLQERMVAAEVAYKNAIAPVIESQKPLRASNARAYRAVRDVLKERDAKLARIFCRQYFVESYPYVDPVHVAVQKHALLALRTRALTDDQRSMIRSIHASWSDRDDRIMDELMVLLDKEHGTGEGVWLNGDAFDQSNQLEIDSMKAKRDAEAVKALDAINSAIGVEWGKALAKFGSDEEAAIFFPESRVSLDVAGAGVVDGAVAEDESVDPVGWANDWMGFTGMWVARRMEIDWAERIEMALGCDDAASATLRALMEDYWKEWDARIKPQIGAFGTLHISPNAPADAVTENIVRTEADVAKWVSRYTDLERVRREIEDRFFEDVAGAVAEPASKSVVQMLRVARICGERVSGVDTLFDLLAGGEESGNALFAATGGDLSAVECKLVAEAVAVRLAEIVKVSDDLNSATIEHGRTQASELVAWLEVRKDPLWGGFVEYSRAMGDKENASTLAGWRAAYAKALVQREVIDSIIAVLSPAKGKAVRRAYLREAFFDAFHETEPVESWIKSALALGDLTQSQRSALTVARDEFTLERDAAIEGMMKHMKTQAPPLTIITKIVANADRAEIDAVTRRMIRIQEAAQEVARYAFARNASRDKLYLRLQHTLTVEQLRAASLK